MGQMVNRKSGLVNEEGRARQDSDTRDNLLRRQVLYPTELRAQNALIKGFCDNSSISHLTFLYLFSILLLESKK